MVFQICRLRCFKPRVKRKINERSREGIGRIHYQDQEEIAKIFHILPEKSVNIRENVIPF